jgi:hypothetical protein
MAESIVPFSDSRSFRYALTRLTMDCLTPELPAEFAAGPYALTAPRACGQAGSAGAVAGALAREKPGPRQA